MRQTVAVRLAVTRSREPDERNTNRITTVRIGVTRVVRMTRVVGRVVPTPTRTTVSRTTVSRTTVRRSEHPGDPGRCRSRTRDATHNPRRSREAASESIERRNRGASAGQGSGIARSPSDCVVHQGTRNRGWLASTQVGKIVGRSPIVRVQPKSTSNVPNHLSFSEVAACARPSRSPRLVTAIDDVAIHVGVVPNTFALKGSPSGRVRTIHSGPGEILAAGVATRECTTVADSPGQRSVRSCSVSTRPVRTAGAIRTRRSARATIEPALHRSRRPTGLARTRSRTIAAVSTTGRGSILSTHSWRGSTNWRSRCR